MGEEQQGRTDCRQSPGRSFPTKAAAEEEILTRRINRANTRQLSEPTSHEARKCDCGGYHVFTAHQLGTARTRRQVRRLNREVRG